MAQPALEVVGARQLRKALKDAGLSVQDLKDAHRAVAEDVARAAAPRAPRRTGALAATVRPSGTQAGALVRAGNGRGVPYAGPIHWGWPARHITAQPWVYQAAQDRQPQWEDTYLQALEAIIRTVEDSTS